MAREIALSDKALAAVSIAAGAAVGVHALRRYRRKAGTRIVCTDCGAALPIEDVLDPAVTCDCVAPRDSHEFW